MLDAFGIEEVLQTICEERPFAPPSIRLNLTSHYALEWPIQPVIHQNLDWLSGDTSSVLLNGFEFPPLLVGTAICLPSVISLETTNYISLLLLTTTPDMKPGIASLGRCGGEPVQIPLPSGRPSLRPQQQHLLSAGGTNALHCPNGVRVQEHPGAVPNYGNLSFKQPWIVSQNAISYSSLITLQLLS